MRKIMIILILFLHFPASAAIKEHLCIKYKDSYGWSKGYLVKAMVLYGYELYQKTHDMKYNTYSKYVVIFWSPGEASIIKLDFNFVTFIGTEGEDQEGRKWLVSKNKHSCF